METQHSVAEFSRLVELDRLRAEDSVHEIEATDAERKALAKRFGLLGLARLSARLTLRRVYGSTAIRVAGEFSAEATQACVVSLAPVDTRLCEEIELLLSTGGEGEGAVVVELGDESREPLPPGPLDIGEIVAQHLALALPQYPRAEGAAIDRRWSEEGNTRDKPFAALAKLKAAPRQGDP